MGGKTLGSLFLLISFLQKWLRLRAVRMCVIAQTPLISPFGSIGFRERRGAGGSRAGGRRRREGGGGGGGRLKGTQGEDKERSDFFKSTRNNNCTLNFRYK